MSPPLLAPGWRSRLDLWKESTPRDPTGVQSLGRTPTVTADGKTFVFTYSHNFSDLYAIEGLK